MPGITGRGLTFNLPNFVGELFATTPADTPFLSAIGGLTGGRSVDQKIYEWQTYDLRAPENPDNLEGQDAPQGRERVRQNVTNVVQIFHSTVDISYTKQAATGQRDGVQAAGDTMVNDEMAWQVEQEMKSLARDVENTFLNGVFDNPASNATPRKTQGILNAITTNVTDNTAANAGAGAPLTEAMILDLMQDVWTNGGISEQETATLMVNGAVKRNLSRIFITDKGYQEESRTVAGVRVQTIETDFGRLNVMLNRYMPADTLLLASLEMCAPRFLEIPGKGHFFEEPLAKVGASMRSQLYGEIGLEYGNELAHGVIKGISQA